MPAAIKESYMHKNRRQAVAVKKLLGRLKAVNVVRSLLKKQIIINVRVIVAENPVIVRQ